MMIVRNLAFKTTDILVLRFVFKKQCALCGIIKKFLDLFNCYKSCLANLPKINCIHYYTFVLTNFDTCIMIVQLYNRQFI